MVAVVGRIGGYTFCERAKQTSEILKLNYQEDVISQYNRPNVR